MKFEEIMARANELYVDQDLRRRGLTPGYAAPELCREIQSLQVKCAIQAICEKMTELAENSAPKSDS